MGADAHLPSWYDDLGGFESHAWAMMTRGVADRRFGFHTPALATIGADGTPRSRTVVLRGVDRAERLLRFHSDARAGKIPEIEARPDVSVVFYDRAVKLQVRVDCVATVHRNTNFADEAWAATRSFSRECYRVAPAAGRPIDAGGGYEHLSAEDEGRANFAVVLCEAKSVEALYLAASGHRRARYASSERTWLVP